MRQGLGEGAVFLSSSYGSPEVENRGAHGNFYKEPGKEEPFPGFVGEILMRNSLLMRREV